MIDAACMLFIYCDTALHVGASRGLGPVDLPIQRERSTGYPIVQASGVKGALRAEMKNRGLPEEEFQAIFGPETTDADAHAGALSFGQARILLFPVRSLYGVFAWVTSRDALERFRRDATLAKMDLTGFVIPQLSFPGEGKAFIAPEADLESSGSLVLEDYQFDPEKRVEIAQLADWLQQHTLPDTHEYWKKHLSRKLCVLHENAFRDFIHFSTEVQFHNKLNETKTVDSEIGGLWTTECLPPDSLLYAPLLASPSRKQGITWDGWGVLRKFRQYLPDVVQLGGNETTGRGFVSLRLTGAAQ